MRFLEKLKYKKEILFKGDLEKLENTLYNLKSATTKKLNNSTYKISSNFSLGTLIINNMPGLTEGIYIKVKVTEKNENELILNLSTDIRIEHYFFAGVFLIGIIALFLSTEFKWQYLFILLLWPLSHLWFQFIYRSQEECLVQNFIKNLKKR